MRILVTGGAGYIGSFMVKTLVDKDYDVVVIDSLERGHVEVVDKKAELVKADLKDEGFTSSYFENNKFDAVLHFAGYISVAESVKEPDLYRENNVIGSQNLFSNAVKNGTNKFIFSSTAAVYGSPEIIPIPEDHSKKPESPYGETKLATEEFLASLLNDSNEVSYACLRYFNACGGSLDGSMGENHDPETHIIPIAMKSALTGKEFNLFGTDYNTPDGTCVRDYIHVLDLVEAHLLALDKIISDPGGYSYNVGTGNGVSNRQIVDAVENISGLKINIIERERRPGDADRLIADPSKIKNELGFTPIHSDLETIIESAWKWHSKEN